jgi:adenine phosphoribosyltransferase
VRAVLLNDTGAMGNQGRGPRPKADPDRELRSDLRAAFRWRRDRADDYDLADPTGWWADPHILSRLGPALAALFVDQRPTLVVGLQSRGSLLGALVALHLHLGLVEVRKDPRPSTDSDRWLTTRTPPDYRDRHLELGVRRDHLDAGQRALLVDDWIETGGQALAVRTLVQAAGATWCGAAVIVDGLRDSHLRHDLQVRALLNLRDL